MRDPQRGPSGQGARQADQSHLHREVRTFTGLTPTAVAAAPWLAIDDVAWPASSPGRRIHRGLPNKPASSRVVA